MPTVILMDRSLSMRRPASKDHPGQTRHSLACRGLECFFDYMEAHFPLEYTCMLSFSSVCEVVVPFTRNYGLLREKLGEIEVLDRTDLHTALVAMVEVMVAEWGAFAPCQVVIVTDGSPGVRHQDFVHRKSLLNIPFPCQLHVLCIATRDELSHPIWLSKMQRLCESTRTSHSEIYVPSNPLTAETVKAAFMQLAKTNFRPYTGILKCGHMQSTISLSPSPYMHKSKFDITISAEHKYPKLDASIPNLEYPKEITLCGFLETGCVPFPPIFAKHFVLDPDVNTNKSEEEGKPGDTLDETQKPSFRVLLHGSLKCESKTALVQLGEKWFGLLSSQTSSSKKSNLVLSVLYPDADIPWLGPFLYLGSKPTNVDPRITQNEKDPFPVVPPRPLSFQSRASLIWPKEPGLQADVTKVIRYSRKLPEKEASLVKELNKLRLVALTYGMPELLEVLSSVLLKEETTTSNPQIKTLLQTCVHFLSNNKNPQERLAITHK